MDYRTLQELYNTSVERFPERCCSSLYQGESLTYREFSERVERVSEILAEGGLVPGDKVALLSNNMPNWAVCYFATVCSGMVIVPILPDFSSAELEMIINHCEAKALFVSDKLFSKISKNTVARLNIVVRTMNLGIIAHGSVKSVAAGLIQAISSAGGGHVQKEAAPKVERHYVTVGPDDLAAIIYTSGTTSAPKGVMLTHGNLASQINMDAGLYPVYEEDVFLSILPLSHTYECSLGMIFPFSAGSHVIYLDKLPTASTLMPAMRNVRPTIILSVPLIIEKIYRSQVSSRFKKNKIKAFFYSKPWFRRHVHRYVGKRLKMVFGGRLRFFGIGGAKLDADTEQFLMEARFPYAVGYGLTETAPLLAGAVPGKVKFRSTGPPMDGVRIRLENVDPNTGQGEIVALSPSTMIGYYKNPEATQNVFTPDGWFRTRDMGHFDEEGNLYIVGRFDNMIVGSDGENIYPEEIESVINSHFLVTDSIVKKDSGKLVAMVKFDRQQIEEKYRGFKEEVNARVAELKQELKNYVNSKVSRSARISDVEEQHADFEKTPTHKIKRFKYNQPQDNPETASGSGSEQKEDNPDMGQT